MTQKKHKHLVAIVGRPNVGKSTLFNRIYGERKSLVYDEPGVTRDRVFARCRYGQKRFFLCDTGGFEPHDKDSIKRQLVEQAQLAIEEASCVIFVVDIQDGIHPVDQDLIRFLRKSGKPFYVAINKCDTPHQDLQVDQFLQLGVNALYPISATHDRGIADLLDEVTAAFHEESEEEEESTFKLAIIGRPNVGKSSILNRITGEVRSIVDDRPGTTRDSVDVFLTYFGQNIQIIDTAGIRRKGRMVDNIEKFSVLRAMESIESADVAILVIDALIGPTEGDARVAGYAYELRKPILIVVNKWDLIPDKDTKSAQKYTEKLKIDLKYISYAPIVYISALENLRVSRLLPQALELYQQGQKRISTSKVNNLLRELLVKHTPPLRKNKSRRIKFLYATQVTVSPPRFVIFCSDPQDIHFSYKRFIENEFRKEFGFEDIPVQIYFRERERVELNTLLGSSYSSRKGKKEPRDILEHSEEEMRDLRDIDIVFDDEE